MIELYVTGQSVKLFTPVIAADSLSYLRVKVHFKGEEWEGYTRWLHLRQGELVYDLALDESNTAGEQSAINLTHGEWEIYLTGTRGEARLTTVPAIITVKESGLTDAPLHVLPQSVAEQVDAKASAALLIARELRDDAENGRFDGRSFAISGFFESLEALEAEIISPKPGEMYSVGTQEPYEIYIWDARGESWLANGSINGAKGDRGESGAVFTPSLEVNGNLSWTNDRGLQNPETVNIRGPMGERGEAGADGQSPYQIARAGGYTGTEQTYNSALTSVPYHNARHLPDGADPITVKSGNIENAAVTGAKLADNSVGTSNIAEGAVTRIKLAGDSLYSPIKLAGSASTALSSSEHLGRTLMTAYNIHGGSNGFMLNQAGSESFPVGAELAICRAYDDNPVTIETSWVRMIYRGARFVKSKSFILPELGSMLALKKLVGDAANGDVWLLTGDYEEV